LDTSSRHILNSVEEDWLVGNGHQLFCAGVGDWAKPGPGTAAKNETLHGS
jgi:hypothetical protein